MKLLVLALLLVSASSFMLPRPVRVLPSKLPRFISTGDDQSEQYSLDISKTIYTSTMKSPKDSYLAFAEKGMSNAKMAKTKILHQSILGGAYVGFGGLLSLCIAGNLMGISAANPGIAKMAFASLFPGEYAAFLSCFMTNKPSDLPLFFFSQSSLDSHDGRAALYRKLSHGGCRQVRRLGRMA